MEPITIHLMSGKSVNLLDLRPEDIHLAEICHRLSQICRYAGATPVFYSVAEHSLNLDKYVCRMDDICTISRATKRQLHLAALLHDAAEAYVGDMIGPIKHIHKYGQRFCSLENCIFANIVRAVVGENIPDFACIRRFHVALTKAELAMFNGERRACHYADLVSGDTMPNVAGELYDRLLKLGVKKHG